MPSEASEGQLDSVLCTVTDDCSNWSSFPLMVVQRQCKTCLPFSERRQDQVSNSPGPFALRFFDLMQLLHRSLMWSGTAHPRSQVAMELMHFLMSAGIRSWLDIFNSMSKEVSQRSNLKSESNVLYYWRRRAPNLQWINSHFYNSHTVLSSTNSMLVLVNILCLSRVHWCEQLHKNHTWCSHGMLKRNSSSLSRCATPGYNHKMQMNIDSGS